MKIKHMIGEVSLEYAGQPILHDPEKDLSVSTVVSHMSDNASFVIQYSNGMIFIDTEDFARVIEFASEVKAVDDEGNEASDTDMARMFCLVMTVTMLFMAVML